MYHTKRSGIDHKTNTLHIVSKPTLLSTNWFFRSPFKLTGTPTTCKSPTVQLTKYY